MAYTKRARANWLRLPEEMVDLIARRIATVADYVRFRAVCTAWRSATPARLRHLPRQLPWLALPSAHASGVLRFFSLADGRIHSLQMPPEYGKGHCCGSSSGWFVFVATSTNFLLHYKLPGHIEDIPSLFAGVLRRCRADNLLGVTPVASLRWNNLGSPPVELDAATKVRFSLLNPLTRECMQLPPLDTRDVLEGLALEPGGGYIVRGRPGPDFSCNLEYIRRHLLSRFVLSSDPTSGDCVAMASFCNGAIFALCRPGRDPSWTILATSPFSSFQDIVFHGGRFYTVDTRLVLYVCDVGPPARIENFPCSREDWTACPLEQCAVSVRRRSRGKVIERVYLVEFRGDLLMVLKTCDDILEAATTGEEEESDHNPTPDFEVYKLDTSGQDLEQRAPRWVELESLEGGALFLGPGDCFSLPAGDIMGECPGNCIYFSDSRPEKQEGAVRGEPGFGVFHLEDGHVERVSISRVDPGTIWQPSLWISPSL